MAQTVINTYLFPVQMVQNIVLYFVVQLLTNATLWPYILSKFMITVAFTEEITIEGVHTDNALWIPNVQIMFWAQRRKHYYFSSEQAYLLNLLIQQVMQ